MRTRSTSGSTTRRRSLVVLIVTMPACTFVRGRARLGVNVQTDGSYRGHHIVFTSWQASHLDQAYMWCSDVNFG